METKIDNSEYVRHAAARNAYTAAIISSKSHKKLIVAGPGTGKSYLFQQICKANGQSEILTLSFINELVDDLSRDLHQLSEVKTRKAAYMRKKRKELATNMHRENVLAFVRAGYENQAFEYAAKYPWDVCGPGILPTNCPL